MTANFADGFRIFQSVHLQPIDSCIVQCIFDGLECIAGIFLHLGSIVRTKMDVGRSLAVSGVNKLFA